jgi:hypothetical protein
MLVGPFTLCREPYVELSAKKTFTKFYLHIANKFEITSKLNMTLHMLCIAYKKVVVVKLKIKLLSKKFKIKFLQETKPSNISSNFLKLIVGDRHKGPLNN